MADVPLTNADVLRCVKVMETVFMKKITALIMCLAACAHAADIWPVSTAYIVDFSLWDGNQFLTGVSPTLQVVRSSDGYYWSGSAWQSGAATVSPSESAVFSGRYTYTLSTTAITSTPDTYLWEAVYSTTTVRGSVMTPTLSSSLTAAAVDAIWDEPQSGHTTPDTFGDFLDAAISTSGGGATADEIWDELLSGHATTGSAGAYLTTVYSRLGSMRLTVQNPVASDGTLTIVQGDDYSSTSSLSISRTWSGSNLTGGTMAFGAMTTAQYQAGTGTAALDSIACTFTGGTSGSTVVVTIPLTAAQTGALSPSPADDPLNYVYQIKCTTTGGKVHTLFLGSMTVKRSVD